MDQNSIDTKKDVPDFNLYVNVGSADRPRTKRIGSAWKHDRGEGINLVFDAYPISGKVIAFPNGQEEEE